MAVLVFVVVFVLAIALYAAVLLFDAYLLSAHVPTLIADPSNFGAWLWVIIAVASIVGMGASTARSTSK